MRCCIFFVRDVVPVASGIFSSDVLGPFCSLVWKLLFYVTFNKLTSVFYASILLLMINFVKTLSKCCNLSSIRGQTYKQLTSISFLQKQKAKTDFQTKERNARVNGRCDCRRN